MSRTSNSEPQPQLWKEEADSVISDITSHVSNAAISEHLQSDNQKVYLNLTTLEQSRYCVELSACGFRVVGNAFDDASLDGKEYYETPYSLLSAISPTFSNSFGNALLKKLQALENRKE